MDNKINICAIERSKSYSLSTFKCGQAAKEEIGNRPHKKGKSTIDGIARCTFEDKILMSDIVFVRAWAIVKIPRNYIPLTTGLEPRDKTWQGARPMSELRRDLNIPVPVNKDSLYKVNLIVSSRHLF